jgi:hypothetical protein
MALVTLSIVLVFVASLFSREPPRPISLGTDTYFYGRIEAGEKFGVQIGQSSEQAKHILARKEIRYVDSADCNDSLKWALDCHTGEVFDKYLIEKLGREGLIFIQVADQKVVAIAWDLHLLPNIDL